LSGRSKIDEMKDSRPYALDLATFATQNDIAGMLHKLVKQIPNGDHYNRTYTVTTETTIINRKTESSLPWISVEIRNFGKGLLFIEVNRDNITTSPIDLAPTESIKLLQIRTLYMWSDSECTAKLYGLK